MAAGRIVTAQRNEAGRIVLAATPQSRPESAPPRTGGGRLCLIICQADSTQLPGADGMATTATLQAT
jgi:hypothetical protein